MSDAFGNHVVGSLVTRLIFFCHYLSSEVSNDLLPPVFASQISHLDRRICYYMSKSLKSFNDLTTRTNRFMHSPNFLLVFIICGILFDDKCKYQSLWFKQINASLQILTLIRLAVVTVRMRKKKCHRYPRKTTLEVLLVFDCGLLSKCSSVGLILHLTDKFYILPIVSLRLIFYVTI